MPPRGRPRGVVCHRWGTYVSWPANAPPIWRCHACGLYARLRGQAWYLVWVTIEYESGQGHRYQTALAWTTARPPCKPPATPFPSPW